MTKNNSLTASDKMVWFALSLLIPQQSEGLPILRQHIANIAGISIRTVSYSLRRLEEREIISLDRPHTGTHYTYTLHQDIDDSLLAFFKKGD